MKSFLLPLLLGVGPLLSRFSSLGVGPFNAVRPIPNALLISPSTTISISHTRKFERESLSCKFSFRGSKSGRNSVDSIEFASEDALAVIHLQHPFEDDEQVTVNISRGISVFGGDGILSGFSWDFYTSAKSLVFNDDKKTHQTEGEYFYSSLATPLQEDHQRNFANLNYRTLPDLFPMIFVTKNHSYPHQHVKEKKKKYVFVCNTVHQSALQPGQVFHPFLMILDDSGDVVFHKKMPSNTLGRGCAEATVTPTGMLSHALRQPSNERANQLLHGAETFVLLDASYRERWRLHTHHGFTPDMHCFTVRDDGRALYVHYDKQYHLHQGKELLVVGAIVHETDKNGVLIFEWRSWDHFTFEELHSLSLSPKVGNFWDPLHINSVDWTPHDFNHIYSFRHLGVIKVSRKTGAIMWRMFGRPEFNSFTLLDGRLLNTPVLGQHDVRFVNRNTITFFDNGNSALSFLNKTSPSVSRAVVLGVDQAKRNVWVKQMKTVTSSSNRKTMRFSKANGSVQLLPNGNMAIGWGGLGLGESLPFYSEISPDGAVIFELSFSLGSSYRSRKHQWKGQPLWPPTLMVTKDGLHYSWNGATEVHSWRVLAGHSPKSLTTVHTHKKFMFEHHTRFSVITKTPEIYFYQVIALSEDLRNLGTSLILSYHQHQN